jgi:hypothetical protein
MGAERIEKNLITLDEATEVLRESWGMAHAPYQKSTLYNWISAKKIKRYGPRHCAMVDKDELLRRYGKKA